MDKFACTFPSKQGKTKYMAKKKKAKKGGKKKHR